MQGCTIFTTLDLVHGYLQVPFNKQAQEKTAFVTPDEKAQFTRMIFGLVGVTFKFCRLMNIVLAHLNMLQAFHKTNLTLKLSKSYFGMKQLELLGFVLSSEGIKPGIAKVQAINQFTVPRNVHF